MNSPKEVPLDGPPWWEPKGSYAEACSNYLRDPRSEYIVESYEATRLLDTVSKIIKARSDEIVRGVNVPSWSLPDE